MKCILRAASTTLTPGLIERVTDEEAARAVKAKTAVYKPKQLWRNQRVRLAEEAK